MTTLTTKLDELTASLPADKRAEAEARIIAQAEDVVREYRSDPEQLSAADAATLQGLAEARAGQGITIEEAQAHMDRFFTELDRN